MPQPANAGLWAGGLPPRCAEASEVERRWPRRPRAGVNLATAFSAAASQPVAGDQCLPEPLVQGLGRSSTNRNHPRNFKEYRSFFLVCISVPCVFHPECMYAPSKRTSFQREISLLKIAVLRTVCMLYRRCSSTNGVSMLPSTLPENYVNNFGWTHSLMSLKHLRR